MSQMWPNEDDLILFWLRNGEPLSADNIMRASKEIYQRLVKQAEAGLLSSCLIPAALGDRSLLEPRIILPDSGTIDKLQTGTPFMAGVAQSGTLTTIKLASTASSVSNFYVGYSILITSGTGESQIRTISGYDAITKIATVPAWITVPDSTSHYQLSYRKLSDNDIIVIGNLIFKGSEITSYEIVWATADASDTDYWIYYGQDKVLSAQKVSLDPTMSDPNKLYIARITRQGTSGVITYMQDLRGFIFSPQDSKKVRFTPGVVRVYGMVEKVEIVGGAEPGIWIVGSGVRWNLSEWNNKIIYFLDGTEANKNYIISDTRIYSSPSSKSAVFILGVPLPSVGSHFVIIDTRIAGDNVYDGILHHGHQGDNDGEKIQAAGIDSSVAGDGLAQDANGALMVNPDNLSIEVAGGKVQVKNLGITEDKIDLLAITEPKIGPLAITEPKIGPLAVTTPKINEGAITEDKTQKTTYDNATPPEIIIAGNNKTLNYLPQMLQVLPNGIARLTITTPLSKFPLGKSTTIISPNIPTTGASATAAAAFPYPTLSEGLIETFKNPIGDERVGAYQIFTPFSTDAVLGGYKQKIRYWKKGKEVAANDGWTEWTIIGGEDKVFFKAQGGSQSLSSPDPEKLIAVKVYDSHAAYNNTNSSYVIPIDGYYIFGLQIGILNWGTDILNPAILRMLLMEGVGAYNFSRGPLFQYGNTEGGPDDYTVSPMWKTSIKYYPKDAVITARGGCMNGSKTLTSIFFEGERISAPLAGL